VRIVLVVLMVQQRMQGGGLDVGTPWSSMTEA